MVTGGLFIPNDIPTEVDSALCSIRRTGGRICGCRGPWEGFRLRV